MPVWLEKQNLMHSAKAGRFVGWADCYATIVLADNATFLLVINSIVASRQNSANQPYEISYHSGSTARASAL